jgi:hypothetical protein
MEEDNSTNITKNFTEGALTVVGLAYATGFLIIFTFLERFGLKDAGTEFFKVKYMHVGILFLMFPIASIIPFFYMLLNKESQDQKPPVYLPSIVLIFNTLMVFYIIVAFAPPGFVMQRQALIPIIFSFTTFGLSILQYIIPIFIKEDKTKIVHEFARWSLCIIIALPLDIYSLRGLYKNLWEMFVDGGYTFLIFIILFGITIWRFYIRSKRTQTSHGKYCNLILAACMMFSLYYLSVLTFALRVYPYIPASKGGGDYYYAPKAIFYYKEKYKKSIPNELSTNLITKQLVVMEETENSIFAADANDAWGPLEWKKMSSVKPNIFEIRRESIATAVYCNDEAGIKTTVGKELKKEN